MKQKILGTLVGLLLLTGCLSRPEEVQKVEQADFPVSFDFEVSNYEYKKLDSKAEHRIYTGSTESWNWSSGFETIIDQLDITILFSHSVMNIDKLDTSTAFLALQKHFMEIYIDTEIDCKVAWDSIVFVKDSESKPLKPQAKIPLIPAKTKAHQIMKWPFMYDQFGFPLGNLISPGNELEKEGIGTNYSLIIPIAINNKEKLYRIEFTVSNSKIGEWVELNI